MSRSSTHCQVTYAALKGLKSNKTEKKKKIHGRRAPAVDGKKPLPVI